MSTNPPRPSWEPVVGDLIGRYQIRSILGRGGTSVVYRAHDASTDRTVALKVLRGEFRLDQAYRARLEREGAALQRLEHPNLLGFIESGEHEAYLYVAMEYVAGISLRQLLHMRGPLPIEEGLELYREVLRGLNFAHRHGVLHRDLKPENVLIADKGEVKLSDFGCAKGPGLANVTAEGVVLGTPTYMAPEHFQGQHTPLSDQYSAAVLLFEMLCGRAPFLESEPVALAMAHVGKKPPAPRSLREDLADSVSDAILKGLAKVPQQRHTDLAAMALALGVPM